MAVTPADVAVELGRPTPLEAATETQWQAWIDRAKLGVIVLIAVKPSQFLWHDH